MYLETGYIYLSVTVILNYHTLTPTAVKYIKSGR